MSLRPDEIVVGHVYRGGKLGRSRKVSIVASDFVKWSNVPSGAVGYSGKIAFCKWAVADITQEEKSNG